MKFKFEIGQVVRARFGSGYEYGVIVDRYGIGNYTSYTVENERGKLYYGESSLSLAATSDIVQEHNAKMIQSLNWWLNETSFQIQDRASGTY